MSSYSGIIVLALVLAILPGWVAHRKGHGFWGYYIFGVLLWIIALPLSLMLKDRRPKCPECREVVQPDASQCPHCQSEIVGRHVMPAPIR